MALFLTNWNTSPEKFGILTHLSEAFRYFYSMAYSFLERPGIEPWQLVICGDFYQLPPVPDTIDGIKQRTLFAFEAESWDRCIPNLVTLTKVFRQKDSSMSTFFLASPIFELYNSTRRFRRYVE